LKFWDASALVPLIILIIQLKAADSFQLASAISVANVQNLLSASGRILLRYKLCHAFNYNPLKRIIGTTRTKGFICKFYCVILFDMSQLSPKSVTSRNRFSSALELLRFAELMKRHQLSSENLGPAEIESEISRWYLERPCAPMGDADGDTFRLRALIK